MTNASESSAVSIKEGKAEIHFPSESTVFYNPVQEFNRDLSITILRQFVNDRRDDKLIQTNGEKSEAKRRKLCLSAENSNIRILEALAASGLRSIRYAKEVEGIKEIVSNDFSATAVEWMTRNIKANEVDNIVKPSQKDAMMVMHENKTVDKRFDVVDLDPYGSPAHFLDAAVQSVNDGGILMITCTDLATLCGNTPEACFTKYGSMSLKSKCCHEIALRILLHSVESHANRYGRYVEPLVSIFVDFYIRVFVKLQTGAAKAKNSCWKTSMIFQCCGCESFVLQPLGRKSTTEKGGVKYQNAFGPVTSNNCPHCGSRYHMAGPIWSAPIHDFDFVGRILESLKLNGDNEKIGTQERVFGMLSVVKEEIPDVPLFYTIDRLANIVHCPVVPSLMFRSAIVNAGFRVSSSHVNPQAVKTDAPIEVLWDIYRVWAKRQNVAFERITDNVKIAHALLSIEPKIQADFTSNSAAESTLKKDGVIRFQQKPTRNWGPKNKAKGSSNSVNAAYYCGSRDKSKE